VGAKWEKQLLSRSGKITRQPNLQDRGGPSKEHQLLQSLYSFLHHTLNLHPAWFVLTKDTLREALQITPVSNNQAFAAPPTSKGLINFVNELGYPKLVSAEDTDLQKASKESMKTAYALPRGPLPPVVIREPDQTARRNQKRLCLGLKRVVKMKARLDQTLAGSNPDETSKGQAGPDPGDAGAKVQSIPSPVVHARSDREHMDLDVVDVSPQPSTKRLDEGFTATAYPKVQENAVDWAMQAPLRNRFRDLPEADMKEILHQRMWETESYKTHKDHTQLFEALEKSMNHDHYDELTQDLAEARKKKKKSHESPKKPPGSPSHQPPPPPPPAGPSGASGSSQVPPSPPPLSSTNQESPSKGSAAPSSSKIAEYLAWTTTDIRLRPSISLTPADLEMDEDMAPDKQA
nr:hypothetical protein [Tanacetum cinerariifolium]